MSLWDCGLSLKICTTLSEKSVFSARARFGAEKLNKSLVMNGTPQPHVHVLGMDLLFRAELHHLFQQYLLFYLEKTAAGAQIAGVMDFSVHRNTDRDVISFIIVLLKNCEHKEKCRKLRESLGYLTLIF